jgi:tetratricopeptide (TPR) repeat protein
LNVIGRTSSFAFKDSDVGIDHISAVLGVRHVLQGSVRKAGNQLRISAQLLDEDGRQVWAQSFDRELANVFDIQSEIASAVASTVASQVMAGAPDGHHPDLGAYERYLAGRDLLHRREVGRALEELKRAIDIDPGFAEAHAEWAIARVLGEPSRQDIEAGQAAIARALEIRPTLLRAHAARGLSLLQANPPDPAGAEAILRKVLDQDPSMSDALLWLHNALVAQGRSDEAFEILQRAARIDPFQPSIARNLVDALFDRGKSDEAIRVLERQLEQPKPNVGGFIALRDHYQLSGRLVELNAIAKEQALRVGVQHGSLALSYALLGDWQAAGYWIDRHMRDFPDFVFTAYFPTFLPLWRGRPEEALRRFEESLESNSSDIADENVFIRQWYGRLLARAGRHAAAIDVLEDAVPRQRPLQTTGAELDSDWDPLLALAWSYRHTGANAKADELLSGLWQQCRDFGVKTDSRYSLFLFYCAEVALLRGEVDQALDTLEDAVTAGWRDYYLQQDNLYWAGLEENPRYRALMAKVRADVDRQRAEVARIDAQEDFVAKLDAAMVARRAAGG